MSIVDEPLLEAAMPAAHDATVAFSAAPVVHSVDVAPWRHPYLTFGNIHRFRRYSEQVWSAALELTRGYSTRALRCAFAVNMAQNMYKWARMAQRAGCDSTLFLHPMDHSALSRPEWEEFDGEHPHVLDAESFLAAHSHLRPSIPVRSVPLAGSELLMAAHRFNLNQRHALLRMMSESPGMRHEVITGYEGVYPYYSWARALSEFDVIYAASSPLAAYLSGRPYAACSVGGDLQSDCGRADDFGRVMSLAFNAARFLFISNPHTLAHSRRLGLTNGVYLPYPMDDQRYSPWRGKARRVWEATAGPGVFVLTTCRIDAQVKGFGEPLLAALADVARRRPMVRFVILAWGAHADRLRQLVAEADVASQFLVLPPVGKQRLIDYYRSSDIVLDQLVYGYYGATALEAASIGKPIVMYHRVEHYEPLYSGDVAPMCNACTPAGVHSTLLHLIDDRPWRERRGRDTRNWLLRNHGEERTVRLLLALLLVTAHRIELPRDLESPLIEPLGEEEEVYHSNCVTMADA